MEKPGDHDPHLAVPKIVEATVFKENVKKRIVKENTAIRKIYDNELASNDLSGAALALIPLPDEVSKYPYLFISHMFVLFVI